jgi:2-polyprenyl-6-methoxyphenol hydroxylase-like FAD-dependent oxidoreductase
MSLGKLTKVRIVGSGLIGTSIGLGLVQRGITVDMIDSDPSAQLLANDLVGESELKTLTLWSWQCRHPI